MADFVLGGGLDRTTPKALVPAGSLQDCFNYEVGIQPGYQPSEGFERFDGRMSPSVRDIWEITIPNLALLPNYQNKSLLVSGENITPQGIAFSTDGTKMFMVGSTAVANVFQYHLSTPWDMSTAIYVAKSVSVAAEVGTAATDLAFNDDLSIMYVSKAITGSAIYQYTLGTKGDVSTAVYASKSILFLTPIVIPGMAFKDDGTALYLIFKSDNKVHEYTLSTAWDIETATDGGNSIALPVGGQATGIHFTDSGKRFYIIGDSLDLVHQYSCSTAWDLSTATEDLITFSIASEEGTPKAIAFKPDGLQFYVVGTGQITVFQYTWSFLINENMSWQDGLESGDLGVVISVVTGADDTVIRFARWIAGDVFTANATVTGDDSGASFVFVNGFTGSVYLNKSLSVVAQETSARSMFLSPDGLLAYIIGTSQDTVFQYALTVAWDMSTASYASKSFLATGEETKPIALDFSQDGTKMYIGGTTSDTIFQYTLSTAWDVSTAAYASKSLPAPASIGDIRALRFKPDGTELYMASSLIMAQYTLSTAWDVSTATFVAEINITAGNTTITSLEGFSFKSDGLSFFIIDDGLDSVVRFVLTTAWVLSTAAPDGISFDVSNEETNVDDVFFDGGFFYLLGLGNDKIYQYYENTEVIFTPLLGVATDAADYFDQLFAASTVLRSAITPVPGSGVVSGIKWYKNQQHAVRDYFKINYYFGSTAEPRIGQHVVYGVPRSLTGAGALLVLGEEGIVRDLDIDSGSFSSNSAIGTIVIEPLDVAFDIDVELYLDVRNGIYYLTEFYFTSGSTEPTRGQDLQGQTSGNIANVYRVVVHSGAFADGDATGVIYCVDIDGRFTVGELVDLVSPVTVNIMTFDQHIYDGGGPQRITHLSNNNAGHELAGLYRSSRSGWNKVDLGWQLRFDAGTNEPDPVQFGADTASQTVSTTDWMVAGSQRDLTGWTASAGSEIDAVGASGGANVFPSLSNTIKLLGEARYYFAVHDFGFSLPDGARVVGVEIELTAKNIAAATQGAAIMQVQPFVNDAEVFGGGVLLNVLPKRQALGDLTAAFVAYTFGGENDLWGATIDKDVVEGSDFGMKFKFEWDAATVGTSWLCDFIRMRIHYVKQGELIYFYDTVAGADYTTARLVHFNKESGSFTTDLVTNGDFETDSDWTKGTGWTISGGTASSDGSQGADADLTQDLSLIEDQDYLIVYTVSNYSAGNVTAVAGDVEGTDRAADGTFIEVITAGAGGDLDIRADLDFIGDIDTVACQLIGDAVGTMQVYSLLKPQIPTKDIEIRDAAAGTGNLIANLDGNETMIHLPGSTLVKAANAKYEMIAENVYARDDLEAIYAVSGAGPAFSYDSFYVRIIRSGLSLELDKPRHVRLFQFRLWLAYIFGEMAISVAGDPLSFDGTLNAVATGFGRPITGLVELMGKTMGVLTDQSTYAVTVEGSDFDQQIFAPKVGAIEYTVADAGASPMYADARGISTPETTDKYGDYELGRISHRVHPWLLPRLQGTVLGATIRDQRPVAATVSRLKNQYRLYFADGFRMTLTLGGETPQITWQQLYTDNTPSQAIRVLVTDTDIDDNDTDRMFFTMDVNPEYDHGDDLGYVYEEDRGTSYDGAVYKRWIELSPISNGVIYTNNVWNYWHLYGMAHGYADMSLTTEINFNHPLDPDDTTEDEEYSIGLGEADNAATIELVAYWDKDEFKLRGRHIVLRFQNASDRELPHLLQNISLVDEKAARVER